MEQLAQGDPRRMTVQAAVGKKGAEVEMSEKERKLVVVETPDGPRLVPHYMKEGDQ